MALRRPEADLAGRSRSRWQVEPDVRSLKRSPLIDELRCESPARVRKAIRAHLLAYDPVRGAMAAADGAGVPPRELSPRGACQTPGAFAVGPGGAPAAGFAALCGVILLRLSAHRVGDRPGRFEPRERWRGRRSPNRGNSPGARPEGRRPSRVKPFQCHCGEPV